MIDAKHYHQYIPMYERTRYKSMIQQHTVEDIKRGGTRIEEWNIAIQNNPPLMKFYEAHKRGEYT
jgi:hypothetical protein